MVIYVIRSDSQKRISISVSSRLDYTNPCSLANCSLNSHLKKMFICYSILCRRAIFSYCLFISFLLLYAKLRMNIIIWSFYYQNHMPAHSKIQNSLRKKVIKMNARIHILSHSMNSPGWVISWVYWDLSQFLHIDVLPNMMCSELFLKRTIHGVIIRWHGWQFLNIWGRLYWISWLVSCYFFNCQPKIQLS